MRKCTKAPRPLMTQRNSTFLDSFWLMLFGCAAHTHPTTPVFQTNTIFIIKLISHLVISTIEWISAAGSIAPTFPFHNIVINWYWSYAVDVCNCSCWKGERLLRFPLNDSNYKLERFLTCEPCGAHRREKKRIQNGAVFLTIIRGFFCFGEAHFFLLRFDMSRDECAEYVTKLTRHCSRCSRGTRANFFSHGFLPFRCVLCSFSFGKRETN